MTDDKDVADKLRQAEDWIMTAPVGSEHWKAAWEHIRYLLGMEPLRPVFSEETRTSAQAIADKGILNGRSERAAEEL
jgi:hypothetical protein